MPRRGNVPKREVLPDPIYGSVLVTKLVNSIMLDGKKGVAQKVVYGAQIYLTYYAKELAKCMDEGRIG